MSIIERAADILGAAPQPGEKTSTSSHSAEPGLIERAAGNENSPRVLPEAERMAGESFITGRTVRPGGHGSRLVNIDLERLRAQRVITPDGERTLISENFRRIKRRVLGNAANPAAPTGINLVMVSSALPGEGKTFCAVNLAISIAMELDRTVLLVDADVAKPSVTALLGIKGETEKGLMDVLSHKTDLASVLCRTNIEKLTVLPAGSRHGRATEMLASESMVTLLEEMAERYNDRIIIFDSPPLLVASEASAIAARMGQILVVVEEGKTTEMALKEALSRIEARNVVAVLLNKSVASRVRSYDGYGYDYGYGYGHG